MFKTESPSWVVFHSCTNSECCVLQSLEHIIISIFCGLSGRGWSRFNTQYFVNTSLNAISAIVIHAITCEWYSQYDSRTQHRCPVEIEKIILIIEKSSSMSYTFMIIYYARVIH